MYYCFSCGDSHRLKLHHLAELRASMHGVGVFVLVHQRSKKLTQFLQADGNKDALGDAVNDQGCCMVLAMLG